MVWCFKAETRAKRKTEDDVKLENETDIENSDEKVEELECDNNNSHVSLGSVENDRYAVKLDNTNGETRQQSWWTFLCWYD